MQSTIQVFIAEKNFEGCGGLEMTDEIKVTIAAYACMLLLHVEHHDYYPRLQSILVYPDAYPVPVTRWGPGNEIVETHEVRLANPGAPAPWSSRGTTSFIAPRTRAEAATSPSTSSPISLTGKTGSWTARGVAEGIHVSGVGPRPRP